MNSNSQNYKPIFGIHPVKEAIRSGREIEKIFLQKGAGNRIMNELNEDIRRFKIPFQFVPVEKLNRLVKSKKHQGVVALLSPVTYQNLEDILPGIFERGETPLIIILDRITDVRNMGAISRTAECMGVHAMVVPSRGGAQINSDTVKTSAGALFNLPICRSENLKRAIDFLKRSGLQIIGCTEKAKKQLHEIDFSIPTTLILGSEETGISQEYLKQCDVVARIPLIGKISSLNVSIAAGIAIYEAVRQKNFRK